ncbi:MAG: DHHA2 domain-containing protein [[Clostridium] scindens]
MFSAGSNLKGKSAKEICFQDFKQFTVGDTVFGVGQINSMSSDELEDIRKKLLSYLDQAREEHKLNMVYFMLRTSSTSPRSFCAPGRGTQETVLEAFELPGGYGPCRPEGRCVQKETAYPGAGGSALQQLRRKTEVMARGNMEAGQYALPAPGSDGKLRGPGGGFQYHHSGMDGDGVHQPGYGLYLCPASEVQL